MVQLKKKVTIKTKIPQEETPVEVKPVVTQKPEEPTINVPPTNPPAKKSKKWIWVILTLIAVVVLFLCYKSCDKSTAVETSEDQTETVQVEDKNGSVVNDVNEQESAPSDENEGKADEDVASESDSDSNESENVEPVAENPSTESQTTTATPNSTVQQHNSASSLSISGTLEEKAKAVIRGNYGNGLERKQKLGEEYAEIQGKVNEMYRNGLVK